MRGLGTPPPNPIGKVTASQERVPISIIERGNFLIGN